jgi:predicted nucleic acid-binding protein
MLIEWVTQEDILQAWEVYQSYHDKAWSFTDCVSLVVMERLGIKTAFAFDKHFRQFGTVAVVP